MIKQSKSIYQLAALMFCCLLFCSCVQQKKLIKQVQAFYNIPQPGIIQADQNGEEATVIKDTIIIIFIETTIQPIQWDSAWSNIQQFHIVSQLIKEKTYEAGFKKGTNEKIIITTQPGNYLYQLQLQPFKGLQPKIQMPAEINQLMIKWKYKQKIFFQKSGIITELEEFPSV